MCLTIESPRPVPVTCVRRRRGRSARTAGECLLVDAAAVVRRSQHCELARAADRDRERCAVAGVADRVLGEVLHEHPEHPGPKRQVDVVVALGLSVTPARAAASSSDSITLSQDGERVRMSERRRPPCRSRARRGRGSRRSARRALDLLARLVDQRADVGAGQVGGVEQRQDPRQRRAELVRDGGGEACPQLVEAAVVDVVSSPDRHQSRNPDKTALRSIVGAVAES